MSHKTDEQLLREYSEHGSDSAFTQLVQRHLDLVYSAALRVVRDTHLAQDVSQKVFLALSENAACFRHFGALSSWLHRTTCNLSCNLVRAEVRRRTREQEAALMQELIASEPDPDWQTITPYFDSALCSLSEPDRQALFLRYFERKSSAEIARVLGVTEQAAQKRVARSLARLRDLLQKDGVTVGLTALALLISGNAVKAAPPGLASALTGNTLAHLSLHSTKLINTIKIVTMTTAQKIFTVSAVMALLAGGLYHAHRNSRSQHSGQSSLPRSVALANLSSSPANLRNLQPGASLAQRTVSSSPAGKPSAAHPFPSTQLYQVLKSKAPRLSRSQVESFLNSQGRSAGALLAGFRTSGDRRYLTEAAKSFPRDPQVAFEAAIANGTSSSESRNWLDTFKQAAPGNSLADYLSAEADIKAGQPAQTLQELASASSKKEFNDYTADRVSADEAAYLSASYPPGEAKLIANAFVTMPHLMLLKDLGQDLVPLGDSYAQSGQGNLRDSILQETVNLGRQLDEPSPNEPLSSQLIGISIERSALGVMDPSAQYDSTGQTVQQRLELLAQRKEDIHVLTQQADPIWQSLSDQQWADYHAQLASSGEELALHWLINNFGNQ